MIRIRGAWAVAMAAALPIIVAGAGGMAGAEAVAWDFESDAKGLKATDQNCGIVAEPGKPGNHVYQIMATKPHHTRLIIEGSEKTPDHIVSVRYRVVEWTGEYPVIYVYGRSGGEGFRALAMRREAGTLTCYHGQDTPATTFGKLAVVANANVADAGAWTHAAVACNGNTIMAKAWREGSLEPQEWQVEGTEEPVAEGAQNVAALGVWTSPRTPSTAKVFFDDLRYTPLTPATAKALAPRLEPRPPLDVSKLAASPGVTSDERQIVLATKNAAIAFDANTGAITHFADLATSQEFVAPAVQHPLFTIRLTKPYEGKSAEAASRQFRKVTARKTGPMALAIEFEDLPGSPIAATVIATARDDGAIALQFTVRKPPSGWSVASVVFPRIAGSPALGGDGNDDEILIPFNGGAVLSAPGQKSVSKSADYPGWACAQLYAHYDKKAGMCCALEDPAGNSKQFTLACSAGRSVSMDIEHRFPETPDQDAALSYSVVLRSFHGDWRTAAEMYRVWAAHAWGLKPLAARDDIAPFVKEGWGALVYSVGRGQACIDKLGAKGEKLAAELDAYRQKTGMKHYVLVPYGWENRGMWAGINYLPANPSNEYWQAVNETLRAHGDRTSFLLSGYWWVTKRQQLRGDPPFDDTADFQRRRDLCVQNADGSIWTVDNYDMTGQAEWRGLSAALCHGSPKAAQTLKESFLGCAKLDVPLLSFDQEIGGQQKQPCYNREHGHPPGYGPWMWTDFRDLCAAILKEGKPLQPELGLLMENESELAIPYMATYWSRQFGEVDMGAPGARGCGLFSYLYHEYVTMIGAACVQGQGEKATKPDALLRCRIHANNLTRGLIPGPFVSDVKLDGKTDYDKTVTAAFLSFSRPYSRFPEYLIQGRLRRPPQIECANIETWYWVQDRATGQPRKQGGPLLAKRTIQLPAVTAGCFQAPDGSMAAVIANSAPTPEQAIVTLPTYKAVVVYQADRTEESRVSESKLNQRVRLSLEPFGVRVIVMK